jgi:hypothetical protein
MMGKLAENGEFVKNAQLTGTIVQTYTNFLEYTTRYVHSLKDYPPNDKTEPSNYQILTFSKTNFSTSGLPRLVAHKLIELMGSYNIYPFDSITFSILGNQVLVQSIQWAQPQSEFQKNELFYFKDLRGNLLVDPINIGKWVCVNEPNYTLHSNYSDVMKIGGKVSLYKNDFRR